MPVLLILVLGIIEFGFVLAQMNEVRHGHVKAPVRPQLPDPTSTATRRRVTTPTSAVCDSVTSPGRHPSPSSYRRHDHYDYRIITVVADTESLSNDPIADPRFKVELIHLDKFGCIPLTP